MTGFPMNASYMSQAQEVFTNKNQQRKMRLSIDKLLAKSENAAAQIGTIHSFLSLPRSCIQNI